MRIGKGICTLDNEKSNAVEFILFRKYEKGKGMMMGRGEKLGKKPMKHLR